MQALLLFVLFATSLAHASDQLCRSQLLSIRVSKNAVSGVTGRSALHFLRGLAPTLQNLLQQDYEIDPIAFPAKAEECDRLGVNCPENFCTDRRVDPELKKQLCFALPCPIFEGTKHVGKCNSVESVYGATISFPEPLSIKRLRWEVKSIDTIGKEARICARISELSLSLATELDFDTTGTRLPDRAITITNILGDLDQPRDICLSASLDLSSHMPVQNVKIVHQSSAPFISDQMLRTAAKTVKVSGLSGYPQKELEAVVPELLPVLVHPLRESIEGSIAQALGDVLEEQVAEYLQQIDDDALLLDTRAFMNELSFTPADAWKAVAFHECRELVLSGKSIPVNHSCLGIEVTFFNRPGIETHPITINSDTKFFLEGSTLAYSMSSPQYSWPNVVADSFKKRLLNLQLLLESNELSPNLTPEEGRKVIQERRRMLQGVILPFLASIEKKRAADNLFPNVEIQGDLTPGQQREVGVAIPGICSPTAPSSFEKVSIPNCPIQAFVDLNQFNLVLKTLWEKGRICSNGQGAYDPNSREYPNGCVLPTSLIYCRLNNPPQLRYISKTGQYATDIKLRNCSRDILPFGMFGAKLGGDFDATLTFKPKACHNGDFCIDQPQVTWKLLPGSETGLLKDPFLRRKIISSIDASIKEAMSKTLRIPFASATSGFMSEIPLKAEGRIKAGQGYFGVCLKEDR